MSNEWCKRKYHLTLHVKRMHIQNNPYNCSLCKKSWSILPHFQDHMKTSHSKQHSFVEISSAFRKKVKIMCRDLGSVEASDPMDLADIISNEFVNITERELLKHPTYKIHGILFGLFEKVSFDNDATQRDILPLRTKTYTVNAESDLVQLMKQMSIDLCER